MELKWEKSGERPNRARAVLAVAVHVAVVAVEDKRAIGMVLGVGVLVAGPNPIVREGVAADKAQRVVESLKPRVVHVQTFAACREAERTLDGAVNRINGCRLISGRKFYRVVELNFENAEVVLDKVL